MTRGHARPRLLAATAALVCSLLGVASIALAVPSSRPDPIDPVAFSAIDPQAFALAPMPSPSPGAAEPPPAIPDFRPDPPLSGDAAADRYGQPSVDTDAPLGVIVRPTPTPRPRAATGGGGGEVRARGDATWYCLPGKSACHHAYSGGMYAAAGPELRVGDWRGRQVRACSGDRCVRVTLIDWCACSGDRVIDLYSDAFRRIAPLSAGVIPISVRW